MAYAIFDNTEETAHLSLSNGDLTGTVLTGAPNYSAARSTIGKSTGKWYWEITVGTLGSVFVGMVAHASTTAKPPGWMETTGCSYRNNGYSYLNSSDANEDWPFVGATFTTGAVIGLAFDADAHTLKFYKNNVLQGTITGLAAGTWYPAICIATTGTAVTANFGATALTYTPPTGYTAGVADDGTTATIALTTDAAVVAVTGTVPEPTTASITFTTDDAAVAITAEQDVPTATVAITADDATVAATAELEYRAAVSFTTDNTVLSLTGVTPYLASVAITTDDAVVSIMSSVSSSVENFSAVLRHKTTNGPITGLATVYLKIRRESDGYRWDFSNNAFSLTPTTETLVLQEVDAVSQPGLYEGAVTVTSWNGWMAFEATYDDGAYTYYYPGEAYYLDGVRATGRQDVPTAQSNAQAVRAELAAELARLDAAISSRGTAAENAAAVLAAAQAAPIHSDARRMNGATINGTGVANDQWRGA